MVNIYAANAPLYLEKGIVTVPVMPGTKACKLEGWQKTTLEQAKAFCQSHGDQGLGILLGTPVTSNLVLAALDIDHDTYVRPLSALLKTEGTLCEKRGKKGSTFFVLASPVLKSRALRRNKDEKKGIIDFLAAGKMTVLPPTLHPELGAPYDWLTPPLHEIDLKTLPIIGA